MNDFLFRFLNYPFINMRRLLNLQLSAIISTKNFILIWISKFSNDDDHPSFGISSHNIHMHEDLVYPRIQA